MLAISVPVIATIAISIGTYIGSIPSSVYQTFLAALPFIYIVFKDVRKWFDDGIMKKLFPKYTPFQRDCILITVLLCVGGYYRDYFFSWFYSKFYYSKVDIAKSTIETRNEGDKILDEYLIGFQAAIEKDGEEFGPKYQLEESNFKLRYHVNLNSIVDNKNTWKESLPWPLAWLIEKIFFRTSSALLRTKRETRTGRIGYDNYNL